MRLRKQDDGTFHLNSERPGAYSSSPVSEDTVLVLAADDVKQIVLDSGYHSDDAMVASLKDQIDKMLKANDSSNADKATLEQQLSDQQGEINKLRDENTTLQAQIAAAQPPAPAVPDTTTTQPPAATPAPATT